MSLLKRERLKKADLSPEATRLLSQLRRGADDVQAAEAVGVPLALVRGWQRDPDFARFCREARAGKGAATCLSWQDLVGPEELGEPAPPPPRQPPPRRRKPRAGEPSCARCGALASYRDSTIDLSFCSPSCNHLHRHGVGPDQYEAALWVGLESADPAERAAAAGELAAARDDALIDQLQEREEAAEVSFDHVLAAQWKASRPADRYGRTDLAPASHTGRQPDGSVVLQAASGSGEGTRLPDGSRLLKARGS